MTMRRRRVYIAGPMRGIPQFNFPAFDAAKERAIAAGFDPISPADLDRNSGFNEMEGVPITNDLIRQFVKRDTDAILSLRAEDGDAIAFLPGWEKSTGATAEYTLGKWLKLAFLDAKDFEPIRVFAEFHQLPAGCAGGLCFVD